MADSRVLRVRKASVGLLAGGLALLGGGVFAPAATAGNGNGAVGTVKVDGLDFDVPAPHDDNEPKVSCDGFEVQFFGFSAGSTADIVISVQGGKQVVDGNTIAASDYVRENVALDGSDQVVTVGADDVAALAAVSDHLRLDVSVEKDGTGVYGKSKVFKLEGDCVAGGGDHSTGGGDDQSNVGGGDQSTGGGDDQSTGVGGGGQPSTGGSDDAGGETRVPLDVPASAPVVAPQVVTPAPAPAPAAAPAPVPTKVEGVVYTSTRGELARTGVETALLAQIAGAFLLLGGLSLAAGDALGAPTRRR